MVTPQYSDLYTVGTKGGVNGFLNLKGNGVPGRFKMVLYCVQ